MSSGDRTHRNRLIAGLAILVVLLILVIYSLTTLFQRISGQAQVGRRSPLAELAYCGAEQDRLCIVSFTQEVDGAMQVNFQTPHAYFPEFILTISQNGTETTYECERVEDAPTSMHCTGAPQVPGQVLQFKVISKLRGILLAEGKFTIIGIALVTPEILYTATEEPTATPTETPSALPAFRTPIPVRTITPGPSYPNPSYP